MIFFLEKSLRGFVILKKNKDLLKQ